MSSDQNKLFEIRNNHSWRHVRYYGVQNNVDVAWYNPDGTRFRDLNWLERNFAYGVSVKHQKNGETTFTVSALKSRTIKLKKNRQGNYIAVTHINNHECQLDLITVQVVDGKVKIPKVEYIDISGRSLENNQPITERYVK